MDEKKQELFQWSPEQIQDMRFVGYSYIRQGKYDIGLTFFEALAAIDPHNAYDIQTLGALQLQLNDLNTALETLDAALQLDLTHAPTQLNRTKTLLLLGFLDQGLKLARKLEKHKDPYISDSAGALLLAYPPLQKES